MSTNSTSEPIAATYKVGSDCYAGEVVLTSPKRGLFTFRSPHLEPHKIYCDKAGIWRVLGRRGRGPRISLGEARDYRDPSF